MIPGRATPEDTAKYASRFPAKDFYREIQGLCCSSLGLGTYLGAPDDPTDESYTAAALAALRGGVNFLDTAINYRHQRSERALGLALREVANDGEFRREGICVCTKAGFLTPGAVPDFLRPEDIAGRAHSMQPDFLADQIDRSRANLQLDTLDVFYLHNPEAQLQHVSREIFEDRVRAAFAKLEELSAAGKIHWYGTATWNGYREAGQLDLPRIIELAREAGGTDHHFRFIQLPFNLGMAEAYTHKTPYNVLEVAAEAGISVVASATLYQGRLTANMPDAIQELLPGCGTDPQRAIQFTRSTPGISVSLVGMSNAAHVRENLAIAQLPPLSAEDYLRFYS